jgi:uncharacterized protein
MQWSYLTPKAHIVPLSRRGLGCIVEQPITRGETTAAFGGWAATAAELTALERPHRSLAIQIDDDLYLVSPTQSPGDCINHSCDPSCGLVGSVLLIAMRDIAAGEELSFDYATADSSDFDEFDCHCGTRQCRGRVSATDWMRPDLQQRYAGYFSPYIERRISSLTATQRGTSGLVLPTD